LFKSVIIVIKNTIIIIKTIIKVIKIIIINDIFVFSFEFVFLFVKFSIIKFLSSKLNLHFAFIPPSSHLRMLSVSKTLLSNIYSFPYFFLHTLLNIFSCLCILSILLILHH
jgi:hypothetical protein